MTNEIRVPVDQTIKDFRATVTVTGLRKFNARCWLGMALLKLAAWVLPFKTEVDVR